ncbi:hypothetical protein GDO78_013694 [Eleutherodactylus coqui]|uniref:Uncharacterized protein n=1 Tax=Eleutherodactylus coqui TaxID=57060 RepID=A0A8J6BG43_ELECQ|nr:hypothetical protein GDO78_013694 [Eleutherodactylus coqui]
MFYKCLKSSRREKTKCSVKCADSKIKEQTNRYFPASEIQRTKSANCRLKISQLILAVQELIEGQQHFQPPSSSLDVNEYER